MRIAIIGAGISGLTAAYRLQNDHDITVFEAAEYVGGHTNTVYPEVAGKRYTVDTGFIVFNEHHYTNFVAMLREIGVPYQMSDMSFSVSNERTGLEYVASSVVKRFFAQRRNLISPRFWLMLGEVVRFRSIAQQVLEPGWPDETVDEFVRRKSFSQNMMENFLLPMAGAIWSAPIEQIREFPIKSLIQFYNHHRFLDVNGQPDWMTVTGGSQTYVKAMIRGFEDRIRTNTHVAGVKRTSIGASVRLRDGSIEHFDEIIIACHSDQALRMLEDPSREEREILASIPYQRNVAVLHTDASLLPRTRAAWASWNVRVPSLRRDRPIHVTYNMNRLQNIKAPVTFCVTLNGEEDIDPKKVLYRRVYHHPVFTTAGRAAQARHSEISGTRHTHYAGAYWTYGFHEDGVRSGLRVVEAIKEEQRCREQAASIKGA